MPSVADLFGVPHEIEWRGVVYKLRPPTQLEQLEYVRWLERRAREHAGRATELPREQQDNLMRWAGEDAALGSYEWESEACNRSLTMPLGMGKILQLVIRGTTDPEFTHEQGQQLVRSGLVGVLAELLGSRLRSEGFDDPKVVAAVLTTLGLPNDFSSSPSATPPSESPGPNSSDSPTTSCSASTPGSSGTSTEPPS